jgi:putative addiction module killer protein
MVQVYRYKTEAGAEPVTEWMLSLKDNLVQAKLRLRLNRVAEGNFGDCSSVGDGVSELREHIGAGFRMYFGQQGKTIVILLCGGTKEHKRQISIPQKDIGLTGKRGNHD